MDVLKNYALLALAALCVVLGLSTCEYRRQFKSASTALAMLNGAVERQKKEADDLLKQRTAERDERQRQLDLATDKIKTDGAAYEKALADLRQQLTDRPTVYRVRLVPGSCGAGGGGAQGAAAPGTAGGAQPPAATTGVLDPEVGRRLDALKLDMEELQKDFNTCRAHALSVEAATK